jgi:hypothetical protein
MRLLLGHSPRGALKGAGTVWWRNFQEQDLQKNRWWDKYIILMDIEVVFTGVQASCQCHE